MKSKRKTMLVAALAVAVIALAGLGYAANFTAKTTSTGNTAPVTYNVLELKVGDVPTYGNFMITTGIELDTENEAGDITYKFHNADAKFTSTDSFVANFTKETPGEGNNGVLISQELKVQITKTKGDAGNFAAVKLYGKVSTPFEVDGLAFVVETGDGTLIELSTMTSGTNGAEIKTFASSNTASEYVTLKVYAICKDTSFDLSGGSLTGMSIDFTAIAQ